MVRSPGRKPADMSSGRASRRKKKRDSEPWGSRMEHTVCQTVAEVWSNCQPGGLKHVGTPTCLWVL